MSERDAFNSPEIKDPGAKALASHYGQLESHQLTSNKPGVGVSREILLAYEPNKPVADGIHLCGLDALLLESEIVNLGTIAVDRNGKPTVEILAGREINSKRHDRDYYIVLHSTIDPLVPNTKRYFGPQLKSIDVTYDRKPNPYSRTFFAVDLRQMANDNQKRQDELRAIEEKMQSGHIPPCDANSVLNNFYPWARMAANYPLVLKQAETDLRNYVRHYPDDAYSKDRLALVLGVESLQPENAKLRKAMQDEAKQLVFTAEWISRQQMNGSYCPGQPFPCFPEGYTVMPSSIGTSATPYFEGAVPPASFWSGANSESGQYANQMEQFFQQACNNAYRSNALKSAFPPPPIFASPYDNMDQNYNPGYATTFGQQYQFAVPNVGTGRRYPGQRY